MRTMPTLADTTIATLEHWHADQQPLVRAMAEPMVILLSDVLRAQQSTVDELLSQRVTAEALSAQLGEYRVALDGALQLNQELSAKLETAVGRITTLEAKPFLPRSEKTPKGQRTPDARREARKRRRGELTPAEREERRRAAAAKRQAILDDLRKVTIHIPLPSGYESAAQGMPRVDVMYEWMPGELVRLELRHEQRELADGVIVTAPRMDEVAEGGCYGPALYAKVVSDKCLYSMPLRRQERAFRELGAPIPVSSLCGMFHRAAALCGPLYLALLAHVASSEHVSADETPMPVLDDETCHRGWMWVFATDTALLFAHSPSRGNSTPKRVLGASKGTLVVDGYTAYHSVTGDQLRARGGCWSHARRGIYEAREQDPLRAKAWLQAIGELFYIEETAQEAGILGTPKHARLRTTSSKPVVDKLLADLDAYSEQALDHASSLYKAVQYIRNQREPLQLFLTKPAVPIHNNLSERALRIVALLRKNSLFAGNDESAQNYAQLLSLLATCCMHDVNPEQWLADVLIEVQRPVKGRIAEDLLPWNWKHDRGKTFRPHYDLSG